MKKTLLFVFIIFQNSIAQNINYDVLAKKYGKAHLQTLLEYIKIPCDANDKQNILKNYDWVVNQFTQRGFDAKKLETVSIPVLLLERKAKKQNAKTIMFYYHSDGQPVKNDEWQQQDPFVPVLKELNVNTNQWQNININKLTEEINPEWRIFARASSDDKGPGVMLIAALDAINELNINPDYNLKILVDFEEEKGSPNLPSIIDSHKKELYSDLLLIFDGPAHASNLPTITYGARGIATVTLTTYGAIIPLHSGHYGNYSPNPALRMAKLLAAMKDDNGKVIIPGFYDGTILNTTTKAIIAEVPDNLTELNKRLGINKPETVGDNYQESLIYPSLNIRGLKSGEIGTQATTIIPDKAVAEIDIRIVKTSNPDSLIKKLKRFIIAQNYFITADEPTFEQRMQYDKICRLTTKPAYGAFSTDMNDNLGKWVDKAISKTTTKKIVRLPTMGGSVPISPFVSKLGVNAIIVPTVNTDNNQHSANENLRLGNYFDGIKTMIGILTEKF